MAIISLVENKFKFLVFRIAAPAVLNIFYSFFPGKEKTLLIIKNDGIGDYILFRNYLHFLKNSQKFRDFKIYLLANETSKDLAEYLDGNVVDGFFWYAESYFLKFKLVKLLVNLQRLRLHTIIYANYSRKYTTDWLVNNIKAKVKTAVDGDTINEPYSLKLETNHYYTELIQADNTPLHEFLRNKQIFERITAEKCPYEKPVIETANLKITPNNSVVIFTGASSADKKWSPLNFNKLCRLIIAGLKTNITIAGGIDELQVAREISDQIPGDQLSNRPGLNMIELCELIAGAKLLISGDTVAIHLAAALSVPSICIAKGDLYGRFIPYPRAVFDRIVTVFPRSFMPGPTSYGQWSTSNINDLLPEDVYFNVKKLFPIL
jgi:ADP-heptose:LPS heptosyltransferase